MIKLIASDLDGTLLQNGAQALTPRTVPLILRLAECGIIFAAASGRQYPNLVRLFGAAAAKMAFLCENGAFVVYRGRTVEKSKMDPQNTAALIADILAQDDCEVLISGESTSYILPKNKDFFDHMQNTVKNNVRIISALADIPEEIIKVSAYRRAGIAQTAPYFISRWEGSFKCTVSGFQWIDFVHGNVNKGAALASLLASLKIKPDEAAAFGDNYNDLEMLSFVGSGFVMENAAPEIYCRYPLKARCVEDTLERFYDRRMRNPMTPIGGC